MQLSLQNPQAHSHIACIMPDTVPDSLQMGITQSVESASFYPCIKRHKLITV